jgi:hypothetical protein
MALLAFQDCHPNDLSSPVVPTANSPFGIHLNVLEPSNADNYDTRQLPLAAQAGFAWVKDAVACVMPSVASTAANPPTVASVCGPDNTSGNNSVRNFLAFLRQANSLKLRPLIRIDFGVTSGKGAAVSPSAPDDIANYAQFAAMMARLANGLVKDWEVNNEPNNVSADCFRSPPGQDCTFFFQPDRYLQALHGITQAVKGVDGTATIYGPALGTLGPMTPSTVYPFINWLQNSFTVSNRSPYFNYTTLGNVLADVLNDVNVFSFHAYRNSTYMNGANLPEASSSGAGNQSYLDQIRSLQSSLYRTHGGNVVLADSEIGYQVVPKPGPATLAWVPSDSVRAKYEERAAILDFVAGVSMRAEFILKDSGPAGTWDLVDATVNATGSSILVPRLAYYAAKNINGVFNYGLKRSRSSCAAVQPTLANPRIQAFMFDVAAAPGRSLCVYWAGVQASDSFPAYTTGLRVSLASGSPVDNLVPAVVDLLPSGNSYAPAIHPVPNGGRAQPAYSVSGSIITFTALPLKDNPVVLRLDPP